MTLFIIALLAIHRMWLIWISPGIMDAIKVKLSKLGPKMQYFINCPFCASVWFGFIGAALYSCPYLHFILWGFAFGSFITLLHSLLQMLDKVTKI